MFNENNLYYLSDNLIINMDDNRVYTPDIVKGVTTFKKVTYKNWLECFSKYGWEELDYIWITHLDDKFIK